MKKIIILSITLIGALAASAQNYPTYNENPYYNQGNVVSQPYPQQQGAYYPPQPGYGLPPARCGVGVQVQIGNPYAYYPRPVIVPSNYCVPVGVPVPCYNYGYNNMYSNGNRHHDRRQGNNRVRYNRGGRYW